MTEPQTEAPEPTPEPVQEPDEPNPDAEPVEPIEPPDEPAAPEPEPPAAEPSALALSQEQEKKLGAEVKRHTSKVSEILGDAANEAILCPFCNPELQGFLYPQELEHPRDDVHAKMIAALIEPQQVEYVAATDVAMCERCNGEGKTATGSKVHDRKTKMCGNCHGYGYYPPPTRSQNGPIGPDGERELALVGAPPPVVDDADAWGSPRLMPDGRENPNYGKMPQYKNPDLP